MGWLVIFDQRAGTAADGQAHEESGTGQSAGSLHPCRAGV